MYGLFCDISQHVFLNLFIKSWRITEKGIVKKIGDLQRLSVYFFFRFLMRILSPVKKHSCVYDKTAGNDDITLFVENLTQSECNSTGISSQHYL